MEARWVAFRPGGAPAGNSSQRALLPSSRLSLKSLVWWPRPGPGDRGVSGQRQAFPRQQPRDSWRSWRSRLGTEAGVWGSGLLSSPCGKGRRQVQVGVAEPVGAAVWSPSLRLTFLTWTAGSWGSIGPFRDREASSKAAERRGGCRGEAERQRCGGGSLSRLSSIIHKKGTVVSPLPGAHLSP